MKKMTFMACAAMLASMFALNSCKSDEPNNNEAQDKDAVKTEFAIAIPAQAAANRMPSANVPDNGTFAGMKHITLIPFAKGSSAIANSDARLGSTNIRKITDIAADGLTATGNAKRYENISIPLTTASFLVYAEATAAAASGSTDAQKHQGGILAATDTALAATGTPADIHFDLVPVLGHLGGEATDTVGILAAIYGDSKAVNLLALLNAVANAQDGAGTPKAWKAYTGGDDAGMVAMWETYKTMHGFSSFEVKRALSDLYESVEPLKAGAGAAVATLATNIQAAIKTGINVTGTGTNVDPFVFTWKDGYDGYPANLNIPDGSVRVKYDATANAGAGAFVKCEAGDYGSSTQTNPALLTYPTALWYYGNSTIKTANKSMSTQLNAPQAWATTIAAYTTEAKPAAVNSLTRSVAIVNPIQYAVGRLDVFVKLSATSLEDQAGQTVTLGSGNFPLSAVFIGNQRQVLFDFTPTTTVGATKFTIYDNALRAGGTYDVTTAAFTATPANSTFVLETPAKSGDGETDDNADVQIAIELTNNSESGDFIGANGQLIPAGSKFYLVATLRSNLATETDKKVFKQDFLTKAQLTITSLAGAYNEIPDLRTPKLELGMSVDLTWQAGHLYEINL